MTKSKHKIPIPIDLRKVFVQLLFSLAISQVAIRFGELAIAYASIWEYHYSYLHLLLCVIIITTSWVGWHRSESALNSEHVRNVISYPFIVLLMDLYLVISYFIIVRGAESPLLINGTNTIPSASSHIEVLWTMVIFLSYLFWDVITKLISGNYEYVSEEEKFYKGIKFSFKFFFSRAWPTLICSFISIFIYYYMRNETDSIKVSIIDLILIFLFFTFRGFKQEVKNEYEMQEDELSIHYKEDISKQFKLVKYPIDVCEVKHFFKLKYFIVRILPFLLFLSFTCLYFYLI